MQTLPVHFFRITVVFDPKKLVTEEEKLQAITMYCDDVIVGESMNGLSLSIPQGISLIGLYITTLPGGSEAFAPASFANPAITWPVSEEVPDPYLVQNWGFGHASIVAFNTVRTATPHQFTVRVMYGEELYTQDPTIVNEPPMPLG